MNPHPLDSRSAVALIAAAACWGVATVITKTVLTTISPITLLVIQLTLSIALLWPLVFFKGGRLPPKGQFLKVGLLGVLNPGVAYTLGLIGLITTTASMSTLLWASEPVLIIGLAWLILRESLTLRLIVFSTTAILGVILIAGLTANSLAAGAGSGNLLILAGVVCCALYTVLARRYGSTVDPLTAVAIQQSFALLWALAIWPLELGANRPESIFAFDLQSWFWACVSGVLYYALAFWFYLRGLAQVSASQAGAFINLIPVFGVSGAMIFLGERLTWMQWLGAAAIVGSVFAIFLWRPWDNYA